MPSDLILVVGATGQLGGAIARQLLAAGQNVRALSRTLSRLEPLASLGAQGVAGDLAEPASLARACAGVTQVVSTANNVMGKGSTSPTRVDVPGHRNLCAAAREAGVQRLVNISAHGISANSPVDYFRVKFQVDEVIKASGIPWVLVKPSAFMETWVSQLLGNGIRDKGTATLFGDGQSTSNFIAIHDVAQYTVRVLGDRTIRDEEIVVGGPSNLSYEQVVQIIERILGVRAKRRHVPLAVLRLGPALLRPFNEVAARMMAMGHWAATRDNSLPDWSHNAARFGVAPIDVEQYVRATLLPRST